MKTILLFLSLFLINPDIYSQEIQHEIDNISIKNKAGKWGNWEPVNLKINFNMTDQRISINTDPIQIFDFNSFEQTEVDNGVVFTTVAEDTNYKSCIVSIFIAKSDYSYIRIVYSDLEYMYRIVFK